MQERSYIRLIARPPAVVSAAGRRGGGVLSPCQVETGSVTDVAGWLSDHAVDPTVLTSLLPTAPRRQHYRSMHITCARAWLCVWAARRRPRGEKTWTPLSPMHSHPARNFPVHCLPCPSFPAAPPIWAHESLT